MEQGWFERLTEVMRAMGEGDTDALAVLYQEFGGPIRAAVRRELRRLEVRHLDGAEVDGLVLDVCIDLFRRAKAWDPAHGATPWHWARLRVRSLVVAYVGQFADPLPHGGPADDDRAGAVAPPAGGGDEDVLVTFGRLAGLRPDLGLLEEALGKVARPAQQAVLFEVRIQAAQGDPSPAVTVARARALRPDAVRQTCKRVADRLRRLAAEDGRFGPLADLHLLGKAS